MARSLLQWGYMATAHPQIMQQKSIEIPDKWSIIPIHTSDRATFKACRRKWSWNSPSRQNLAPRVDRSGLAIPLWFGTGIHYALERFYRPGIQEDPVVAFDEWFDITYNGGIIPKEWLSRVYDPNPQLLPADAIIVAPDTRNWYRVNGLNVLLPNEDHSELFEHKELGEKMLTFYKDYAARNDDFDVIESEHDFSVPIWDYENNCIFQAVDTREDSPNYEKLLEVHYRGRQDILYKKKDAEIYGIMDHKTRAVNRLSGDNLEDWYRELQLDNQATSYLWAYEVEAQYYNLPHKNKRIEHITFQGLRKTYPKPPTRLKNGNFSIDRAKESTTYDMLSRLINLVPDLAFLVETSPAHAAYLEYVKEKGDEQFIVRYPVTRNRHHLRMAGIEIFQEAKDMLSDPAIYFNPSGNYSCLNCIFRAPCLAMEEGSDWESMIEEGFIPNRDR